MSVKSTVIDAVKEVRNGYAESISNLQKAYRDNRFSDAGKNEYTKDVLDAFGEMVHKNLQKVTDLTASVSKEYVERDAETVAKITNNTEYQMLLSSVMHQLPEIMKCSEQIVRARLAMFKNDPVAREMFIEKSVPVSLLPEYSVGRAAEMVMAIQGRVREVFETVRRSAEELAPLLRSSAIQAQWGYPDKSEPGKGQLMMLDSFLSYIQGFNEDCTEFDASKVNRKEAGYEIMSGRDFAGEIAKKYGGLCMYDLEEAANKAAFEASLKDENGNFIYVRSGNGGATYISSPIEEETEEESDSEGEGSEEAGSEDAGSEGAGSEEDVSGTEGSEEAGSGDSAADTEGSGADVTDNDTSGTENTGTEGE